MSRRSRFPILNTPLGEVTPPIPPTVPSWMTFDGSNDYVTLPSGEGDEPSTAIFIEACIRNVGSTGNQIIVCRGSFMTEGYALSLAETTMCLWLRSLNATATEIGAVYIADGLPIHIAAGWDGSTIYYFVNGVLLATKAASGTLTYDGDQWLIGKMPGDLWLYDGDLSMLRISNVCRHTSSYTPPYSNYASDANTVALYLASEGSGTTLADSGPGEHDGTFKAAGEPLWGDAVDLEALTHGEAMWESCLAAMPSLTGGEVWIHRVSADEYYLYRQVSAAGHWAKFHVGRTVSTLLTLKGVWTGVPTDSADDPPDWTVDPATHLQNGEATEYVLKGTMQGGSLQQWGCAHGGEILDSESWAVDGVATTLTNGQWASGDEIVYSATAHVLDGATRFVDVTKTLTLNTTSMWLEGNYQFDWLENWTPNAENYVLMAEMDATDITTFTIIPGGTDYALSGSDVSGLRTHAMAGWSNSHEAIICYRTDPDAGMRFDVAGANFNTTLNKFYFSRTVEIGAAPEDTSWQWTNRFLALDGCGNHFLKTT